MSERHTDLLINDSIAGKEVLQLVDGFNASCQSIAINRML